MKQEYYVTMLGEFTISFKNKKIYDQSNRSKKPWNLIEYLMANRDRTVSQEELTDLLWDDSESDNPSGALKVLLHRARKSLEPVMPEDGEDLIVLKRGEYSWNRDAVTKVDTDEFELLCNRASDKKASKEERIDLYSEALALYKGDFLPRNNEGWVIPISSYYHKIYMNAVRELIALYYEGQRYEEIINVCRKALTVEKLDESLYFDLINA
ncbi:MAG: winged helix-turn-helix domain-containing protein, partial [Lachnospiraceae bacterium]|nr:winged helix-turn-helix domain-containing protein [Lachnospiraceae bacterium]